MDATRNGRYQKWTLPEMDATSVIFSFRAVAKRSSVGFMTSSLRRSCTVAPSNGPRGIRVSPDPRPALVAGTLRACHRWPALIVTNPDVVAGRACPRSCRAGNHTGRCQIQNVEMAGELRLSTLFGDHIRGSKDGGWAYTDWYPDLN